MKILVFSDSHGRYNNLRSAVEEHAAAGKIDHIFFLGDGVNDIMKLSNDFPDIPITYVYGNCDDVPASEGEQADESYEKTISICGVRFLLMHGHKYDVKYSLDNAAFRGCEVGADVVLFGHTHHAEDEVIEIGDRKIRLINPGSAAAFFNKSYSLLNIVGREVICGFGKIK